MFRATPRNRLRNLFARPEVERGRSSALNQSGPIEDTLTCIYSPSLIASSALNQSGPIEENAAHSRHPDQSRSSALNQSGPIED